MKAITLLLSALNLHLFTVADASVESKTWPPEERNCPKSVKHFAIVDEQRSTSNDSIYCKVVIGDTYKTKDSLNMKVFDYIDCSKSPIEKNTLVLISKVYYKALDKLGNTRCWQSVGLIEVIGSIKY